MGIAHSSSITVTTDSNNISSPRAIRRRNNSAQKKKRLNKGASSSSKRININYNKTTGSLGGNRYFYNNRKRRIRQNHFRELLKNMNTIVAPAAAVPLPPMPESGEVERRFEEILKKMDLPPNKAKVLRNYSLDKKWELVCDQEKVTDQGSPGMYLEKLRIYLDPKGTKKKKKLLGEESSTMVLKHLEISLRTNSIDWVRDFLNEGNNGLQVLVQYLKYAQDSGGLQTPPHLMMNGDSHSPRSSSHSDATLKKLKLQNSSKINFGVPEDDIHVCIQCLRAIMNNTYGFNMVFNDNEAIYCLVKSVLHPSLRTKASVLVLLAAICLVKGGHELIVGAFDRFKQEYAETHRFETLFRYFRDYDEFYVDFMVACMQFINIVVHSVEEMNYRIFLQHEFRLLGLDDYIEKLKLNESEELQTQISAYLENMYDVAQLLEDADQKVVYQQKSEETQMELSRMHEKLQEVEADYVMRVVQLDNRLADLMRERDSLLSLHQRTDNDLNTLRRVLSQKEQESRQQQSRLESRIQELEEVQKSFKVGLTNVSSAMEPNVSPPVVHPPAPIPPPPPPPPTSSAPPPPPPPPNFPIIQSSSGASLPPPPAPPMGQDQGIMTIKRRIQTKYKLPHLNWTPIKPNQLKGTVFSELDDDRVIESINFDQFEDMFKIGVNPLSGVSSVEPHLPLNNIQNGTLSSSHNKKQTLLDHKRLRNLAISRRKLAIEPPEFMRAVNSFDLKALDLESVEILMRVLPNADEVKSYKDYESAQKSIDALSDEDKFMIQLAKIERLAQKLQIMSFMGNFDESSTLFSPSFTTVAAASRSVKDAKKFHKVLEIILAYGNYMNSGKRGGAYGFKIQSLDVLPFLKAPGSKSFTVLHAIAQTVREKFPELLGFTQELKFVEKASSVSMDSVLADLAELEKGMDLTRKEYALRGQEAPQVLSQFLGSADVKMNELRSNAKVAQDAFRDCVEYYGETSKSTTTNSFFTVLAVFSKHFQQADEENLARKKAEAMQDTLRQSTVVSPKKCTTDDLKSKQAAIIDELENKRLKNGGRIPPRRDNRKRELGEMGLGTFDDIISDITRQPYIDASGPSKRTRNSVKDFGVADVGRNRPRPAETEI